MLIKMKRTHVAHVCGVDVGAGAVGAGLSLLEVIPSCIQSLIQLSQTGLQVAWLTCTEDTAESSKLGG